MKLSRVSRLAAIGFIAIAGLVSTACEVVLPAPAPAPVPAPAPSPVVGPCVSSSPAIVCGMVEVGGLQRKFFSHVSARPAPVGGRPMVLFFHGDGGTGDADLASLYAQTDPDGAIVVQFDGPNNIPSLGRGGTAWSFFMDGTGPDDVLFTKTVIDGILNGSQVPGANVNAKRIYPIGGSRGGFMVDTLMVDARTASYFPAGVNLWGNFYCEAGDNVCLTRQNNGGLKTAAVLHIHGDADPVVAPPGRIPNPVTGTIGWPWPMGSFAYLNGCAGDFAYNATLASMGGQPTYLYTPNGACGIDFQLVLVQGAGHGTYGWEGYSWNYLKGKAKP